jgi:hypothetical protein
MGSPHWEKYTPQWGESPLGSVHSPKGSPHTKGTATGRSDPYTQHDDMATLADKFDCVAMLFSVPMESMGTSVFHGCTWNLRVPNGNPWGALHNPSSDLGALHYLAFVAFGPFFVVSNIFI